MAVREEVRSAAPSDPCDTTVILPVSIRQNDETVFIHPKAGARF
jgi:hypothetical protein